MGESERPLNQGFLLKKYLYFVAKATRAVSAEQELVSIWKVLMAAMIGETGPEAHFS